MGVKFTNITPFAGGGIVGNSISTTPSLGFDMIKFEFDTIFRRASTAVNAPKIITLENHKTSFWHSLFYLSRGMRSMTATSRAINPKFATIPLNLKNRITKCTVSVIAPRKCRHGTIIRYMWGLWYMLQSGMMGTSFSYSNLKPKHNKNPRIGVRGSYSPLSILALYRPVKGRRV